MTDTDPTDRGAQDQTVNRSKHLDRQAVIRSIDYQTDLPGPVAEVDFAKGDDDSEGADLTNVEVHPSVLGGTRPLVEDDPVIISWFAGTPPQPYISGSFYNADDAAPDSDGELSWNLGGSRIEMLPNGDINIDAAGLITITDSEGTLTTSDGSSDGTRTVEQPTWGEGSDMPDGGRGDPP
ncbi:hypothetical protein [Halococcus saccharolyticus]|uniref:Uncharacterized protein n=1 Tax=Halococcus saccharolyticus DSM 5350 TaxID=1227455 RepID=M0MRK5_9EURY|nr:hypothetical protein [Halococcus saccharolyticus]EMA47988.1 hypothetical protein C449_00910 [Halococcus saccharolyticus DSM 5350]